MHGSILIQDSEPRGGKKKVSIEWSAQYEMLELEQDEKSILVGGVPSMRNKDLNKVRRLYSWKRRESVGPVREGKKRASLWRGEGSHM